MWKEAIIYSQMVLQYGMTVAVGAYAGVWLDGKFEQKWMAFSMTLLFAGAGFWKLYLEVTKRDRNA